MFLFGLCILELNLIWGFFGQARDDDDDDAGFGFEDPPAGKKPAAPAAAVAVAAARNADDEDWEEVEVDASGLTRIEKKFALISNRYPLSGNPVEPS